MISLKEFKEQIGKYPDDTKVFFNCPDDANALDFVGVDEIDENTIRISFQLNVYRGRD